ncbi:hypothetical protein B9T62_14675 [Paenibacillus donghaensis]|uniref:Uncharacterized protein n=2 Tax=Paenibacillus donghaensis TaxID=414771 RepID=A0A2Z2KJ92_9BACL|nr:hypothetical protein B9T62_14675 [Paenibacillus donghaensis]
MFNLFHPLLLVLWLVSVGVTIYIIVLVIKLARRGIVALDLYIYAKNREIRTRFESADSDDLNL